MTQIIHLPCPGCGKGLRIPAEWVGRSLRCKHCGATLQGRAKPKAAPITAPAPSPAPGPIASAPPDTGSPFDFDAPTGTATATSGELGIQLPSYYRLRRRSRWRSATMAAIAIVLLVAGIAVLFRTGTVDRIKNQLTAAPTNNSKPTPPSGPSTKEPAWPRRLLAVGISNYWYANPIAYGEDDRSLNKVAHRLGEALHIPKDQVAILSDGGPNPLAPTDALIRQTITAYLDSSRPQDRIVLLLVGHAVVIGKEGYIVPIDAEIKAPKEKLIPLAWVYDVLAKCKARQKLLIVDLCRFDPGRGLERPGSGPLDPALAKQLHNPPSGVQVWSACSAGQYSYEGKVYLSDGSARHVGFFLSELYEAVGPDEQKHVPLPLQKPGDSLPINLLARGQDKAPGVFEATTREVKDWLNVVQKPFAAGHEPADGSGYDTDAPALPPLALAKPAADAKQPADPKLIAAILEETGEDLHREGSPALQAAMMPRFDADTLAAYKDDGKDSDLRQAIRRATTLLQRYSKTFDEQFPTQTDNAVKKVAARKQREPAMAMLMLQSTWEDLEKLADKGPREKSKRWRADYDFVQARLRERWVYVYQYDLMLAKVRMDSLPIPPAGKRSSGFRLAAEEKLDSSSGPDCKKMAEDVRKRFQKIAKTYKGTPWEFLARRESVAALGLSWQVMP